MSTSSYPEGAYSAVSADDSEDITYDHLRCNYGVDPALPATTHEEGYLDTLHTTRHEQTVDLLSDTGIHSMNKQMDPLTEQIEPGTIATLKRSSVKRCGSPGLDAFFVAHSNLFLRFVG